MMELTRAQKKAIREYKRDWDPNQYNVDDTFNQMMRDLAIVKVGQTDEEILDELSYIEAHG